MKRIIMRATTRRSCGVVLNFGFSSARAIQLGLLLGWCLSLSAAPQVITFTNKAATFTTLEGTVYRNVNLLKADLYGITWGSGASGGRVAYTNLAAETLDSWGIPSNHVGRLAAQETLRAKARRGADPVLQNLEQDNVREVAFTSLIYEAGAAQQGYKVYFLSLGLSWTNDIDFHIDPSDAFIGRFTGRIPPVKKASDCRTGEAGRVFDRSTGHPGVIFTVSDLEWVSDKEVKAKCSVYKEGLNGYSMRYTLTKKDNRWKVTNKELVSVS